MANLTLDPTYPDSYSEAGSSHSSLSYGLLTPTSSSEFSAVTSRRQSTASEFQSCNESAFDRVPSFSSEGVTTPLPTPPPFRSTFHSDTFSSITQDYDTQYSPLGSHSRSKPGLSSTANCRVFQDPFSAQDPYLYTTAIPQINTRIQRSSCQEDEDNIGLSSIGRPFRDWPESFDTGFNESFDQIESARSTDTSGLDPYGIVYPGLLTSPSYAEYGVVNGIAEEPSSPQTVSPQETFFGSTTSFVPTTPICQPLEDAFQTPRVKSEDRLCDLETDNHSSPCSSLLNEQSPGRQVSNIQERRQTIDTLVQRSSRIRSRGSKRKRRSSLQIPHSGHLALARQTAQLWGAKIIDSAHKTHRCKECDLKFDRPEHYKRHTETETHINRRRELNLYVDNKDTKPHKCMVPGCTTAVTRRDNLKPHYQKTHLFDCCVQKDEKWVENKKRNIHVSPEEAAELGLGEYDLRTNVGRKHNDLCKYARRELSSDMDDW